VDNINNNILGQFIGGRNAKTFRRLYEKLKDKVKHYYTDNWEVYRKIISAEKLTQGKEYDRNGTKQLNIRHYLARMTRRTKVVTKSIEMLNITLRINCYLNEYNGYQIYQQKFLSIFC